LGNSEDIARKHYYQTTDSHFAQATACPMENGAESGARAAQNAAQRVIAGNRGESLEETQALTSAPFLRLDAIRNSLQRKDLADGRGFEPPVDFRPLRFSRPPP
jgi:hypothetical protein